MADITDRVLGDILHVDPAAEHVGDPLSVRREGGSPARDVLADIGDSDDGVALEQWAQTLGVKALLSEVGDE